MTNYNKRDIILVPFPITDFKTSIKRSALVISPANYNTGKDLIIAFMTSNVQSIERIGDYHIKEWQAANLPKPSMIRMKFATIDKNIIIKKLGRLSNVDMAGVSKILLDFFSND